MTTESGTRLPVMAALLATVAISTHLLTGLFPGIFVPLRRQATDQLFMLRSRVEALRPEVDPRIIYIDIDDRSLRAHDGFYLGRAEHARLVRNLARAGVAAQFHDIIFAAPQTEAEDGDLIAATAAADGTYYGMALGLNHGGSEAEPPAAGSRRAAVLDANRWPLPAGPAGKSLPVVTRHYMTFPELAGAATGVGFLDVAPDRDGVYRRAPLLAREGESVFPSLSLRIMADRLGVSPDAIRFDGKRVILPGARLPGTPSPSPADISIPVDRQGRMPVNFVGPWGVAPHYPFSVVYAASDDRFEMEDLRELLEGKIAVVTWVATGAEDIGPVPTDSLYPRAGIHGNVMHSILTGRFLREIGAPAMFVLAEIPLLLLLLLLAVRLTAVRFLLAAAAAGGAYVAAATVAFLGGGLILDIPGPLLLVALSAICVAAYQFHLESRSKAVLHSMFSAYFPASVIAKLSGQSQGLLSAAQKKELSILFSDIKGFTGLTAELPAEKVRDLLNEYFERMVDIVFRHEGTLDKFMGDGLMVFFGDPEAQPDHAERAVRAALEMQKAAREIDAVWRARGDMPLQIRIGINTAPVIVGNMGSSRRLSYTALGEGVNLAQRLESSAPTGGILISARTRELLGDAVPVRAREAVQVKGFARPIPVFDVPATDWTEEETARMLRRSSERETG